MKRLWIAVGLLALAVGLCVSATLYQHRRIDGMLAQLEAMEQTFAAGDRDTARGMAAELAEDYEAIGAVLFCFVPHSDLADSQETVTMLPTLMERGGEEELRMEMARLREQLLYLRGVDDPLWRNIL